MRRLLSGGLQMDADEAGLLIGKYQYRRDVTKVLAEVAYKEEAWR